MKDGVNSRIEIELPCTINIRTDGSHLRETYQENSLTLRLLMSYIYMERLFLMFLDHTQRRTTVGRTPLDE